ncbi:hypothetical protein FDECE_13859 [Fusarium decemcellulare]|nr:hypothetical protein FDECE_13859 [Fusarium decemcellulare]
MTLQATGTKKQSRPILMQPGPIEIDDAVSKAMGHYAESHFAAPFVQKFGEVLAMLRRLLQTTNPDSQPFVIGGSGSLGWDFVGANFIEPGEAVLQLNTGYFSAAFAECLAVYGARVAQLTASLGDVVPLGEIEKALRAQKYKALVVTHVDTSTGVMTPLKPLTDLLERTSPDTLLVVDGVCSVACENILFDDWAIDLLVTGSQKAIGCPPGLSIIMASGRAVEVAKKRKSPSASYYAGFHGWLPIMRNYEKNISSYYTTPPTQLIHALHTALRQILSRPLDERIQKHKQVSLRFKAAIEEMGFKQLALRPEIQAVGLTTICLPAGLTSAEILPRLEMQGFVLAGGLHKDLSSTYIRCGHMGISVMDERRGDVDGILYALRRILAELIQEKDLEGGAKVDDIKNRL